MKRPRAQGRPITETRGQATNPGRLKLITPPYTASGTEVSTATLAAKLADRGAILAPDPQFEHTQCEWCAEVGALTAFRIWRRPNALHVASEGATDVCAACLPNALETACDERGIADDADIRIEYPEDHA